METLVRRPVGRPPFNRSPQSAIPTFTVVDCIPTPAISRYEMKDLIERGQWLADRVTENWRHLTSKMAIGWLRSCLDINEFFFVKSAHAASLSRIVHRSLDPQPSIEGVFVFVDDKASDSIVREGAAHYPEIQRWARMNKADEMAFARYSDVPADLIREALGHVSERQSFYSDLRGNGRM